MKAIEKHLTQDQLIMAVVDEDDLDSTSAAHLSICPDCRLRLQQMTQKLDKLEELARKTAPKPLETPLPLPEPRGGRLFFKPMAVAAMAVLLMVLVVTWPWNRTENNHIGIAAIFQEMEKDEQLMADIEALESFALSGLHMEANGNGYGMIDDEFIDFLVPRENGSFI